MTVNGFPVGDPLTDNSWSETGYRWHDTLHVRMPFVSAVPCLP
jgi:hypothetical protein